MHKDCDNDNNNVIVYITVGRVEVYGTKGNYQPNRELWLQINTF